MTCARNATHPVSSTKRDASIARRADSPSARFSLSGGHAEGRIDRASTSRDRLGFALVMTVKDNVRERTGVNDLEIQQKGKKTRQTIEVGGAGCVHASGSLRYVTFMA